MLPHYTNVVDPRKTELSEPVYANLFEITFEFPDSLNISDDDKTLMMISAMNINIDTTPTLEVAKQAFKFSGRLYMKTPTDVQTTIQDLKIKFYMNMNDKLSMNTWNMLMKWYELSAFNSQTGSLNYKNSSIGSIVAHLHTREGEVYRRVEYQNVMLRGLNSHSYEWSSSEILEGEATFCADYWIDLYKDAYA